MAEFKMIEVDGVPHKIRFPVKRLADCKDVVFEIAGQLAIGYLSHQPPLTGGKKLIWCLYSKGKRVVEIGALSELAANNVTIIGQIVKS